MPAVLERAHLKQPAMLTVWEAMLKAGIVSEKEDYPLTVKELTDKIARVN
jgi:hypothetical protein